MNAWQTEDPRAALSQLVLLASLGMLWIAGEMIAAGGERRSWLLVLAGAVMLAGAARVIWRARKIIHAVLQEMVGRKASGAGD